MYFTVKGKEHNLRRLKGKTITEFHKNLQKEGYPAEMGREEADRVKYAERRNRYALQKSHAYQVKKNMGVTRRTQMGDYLRHREKPPNSKPAYHWKKDYPGYAEDLKRAKRGRKIYVYR